MACDHASNPTPLHLMSGKVPSWYLSGYLLTLVLSQITYLSGCEVSTAKATYPVNGRICEIDTTWEYFCLQKMVGRQAGTSILQQGYYLSLAVVRGVAVTVDYGGWV